MIVSTAAPAKFAREIKQRTGIVVNNQSLLAALRVRPGRVRHLAATYEEFRHKLLALS
jgi:hypothetical protein